ncbi:HAD-IA family hydrolase, partial [candidate division WOR-3 bacterium]|nr:HAD-IA family hydrolase [candidate division WOR-3 bacterium]
FDLDNTLYNEKQFVRSGFRAVSNYMVEKYGINEERLYDLLLSTFSKQGREKVFDKALKKLNLYKKEIVLEMVEVYRNHSPKITIYRDTQEVLPKLKKKYRVGLITGGVKKVQESKVKALNIEGFFDSITYAIEHNGKNNTQVFMATLEKLRVKPSESIYIDDNPLKGFFVARKLGIHTVRILRGEHKELKGDKPYYPEFEIRNLRQLLNIICSFKKR